MPIYDIECIKCGYTKEILQSYCDHYTPKCDKCRGDTRRNIPGPALGLQCQNGIENPGFYRKAESKGVTPLGEQKVDGASEMPTDSKGDGR